MWKCNDCGRVFIDPMSKVDRENLRRNIYAACPYCESDMVTKGQECEVCGEFTEDDFCDDCINDIGDVIEKYGKTTGIGWDKAKRLALAWADRNW